MRIEIPETPKSLNQLFAMNRWDRTRYRDDVRKTVWYLTRKIPTLSCFTEPVTMHLTAIFKDKRSRDLDNYIGGSKYLIDGLRHAGIITDDNTECVKAITMELKKGPENKTIIEITPWQNQ